MTSQTGDKWPDRPPRVYWRRNSWQYKARSEEVTILGKNWVKLGVTAVECRFKYAQIKETLTHSGGMDRLFTRFEKYVLEPNLVEYSDRTLADKRGHVVKLRKVFGKMAPQSLRPTHCARYLDERGKKSKSQANQEFNTLSVVLRYAVRWGVIDTNPCEGISRHKIKSRDRLPTWEEISALMSVATPFIEQYIKFKYKTGLRQRDILTLSIRKIDDQGIHVKTSKTHKKGLIEWDAELRDLVRHIMSSNKIQGETLFCNKYGQPFCKSSFGSRWQYVMDKALTKGVLEVRFWEHDIRATHATSAEDDHGWNATDQLLHENPRQKEAYLRGRRETIVQPLPFPKPKPKD